MTQLMDMDELKVLTSTVDSEFTRFNTSVSLSKTGGFRERQFGAAIAFQDQNRPLSEYYNRVVGFGEDEISLLPEIVRWFVGTLSAGVLAGKRHVNNWQKLDPIWPEVLT